MKLRFEDYGVIEWVEPAAFYAEGWSVVDRAVGEDGEEYDILLNELKKYNPELMDKDRILAITKCDLVDDDTIKEIKKHLPKKVPHVFISSVANQGINELKDLIWLTLNKSEEEDW